MSGDGGGLLVGGEPLAILAASSAVHEVACRTDDLGGRLALALAPAGTTILSAMPFAPGAAAAALVALGKIAVSPASGLGTVFAALEALSLEMRHVAQQLELAGAVGLLATGGLALVRGERPTVLDSADGLDLNRQAITGTWASNGVEGSSSLAVREVRRDDGTTFFVVEATTSTKEAQAAGIDVNGGGLFAEGGHVQELTLRWAVPTEHDARLMVAMASAALVPKVGAALRSRLPAPTEATAALGATGTVVAGAASATAASRGEVTVLRGGGQRYAASVTVAGQAGLWLVGTGGSAAAKVTVERSPAGVVTGVSLSTSTELDRGRHGIPLVEAGNREATRHERTHEVELTPQHVAAAERVVDAATRGQELDQADVDVLADAARDAEVEEHTYDVRHQHASLDVSLKYVDAGGGAAIDTAELRAPTRP